jgi:hypothetical protein
MHFKGPRNLRTLEQVVFVLSFVLALGMPAHAQLTASASAIDFGNQIVGTQSASPLLVEFTNTSSQFSYGVTSVSSSLSQFAYFVSGSLTVVPGGVLDIWIWFTPSSAQTYSGTLTLRTYRGYSVQIALEGNGVSAQQSVNPTVQGTLTLSSSSVYLGAISVGGRGSQVATLTNTGGADVTISNVSIAGPGLGAFGLFSGLVISPGRNASVYLRLIPAASGDISGTVTISSDASNPQVAISVSGSGISTQATSDSVTLTWNPSAWDGITGYNVYRGLVSGGSYSLLTSNTDPSTNFTDTTVQSGQTYFYVVTAVSSNSTESGYSSEVAASVP